MRSSAALLAIINDILDLASIDTGAMELASRPVDIRETIDAAARGVQDRLAEAKLHARHRCAAEHRHASVADAKRVRQVLFNLLSNAVGFSAPGQTVARHGRNDRRRRRVPASRIRAAASRPRSSTRVFDRFESHTLGSRHRGVGLGLSIVRSFVELHGGRVELDSRRRARARP